MWYTMKKEGIGLLKILIAEDDGELCQLFSHVLTKNGYAVKGVADGQKALEAMEQDYFDLLILWSNLISNAVKFSPQGGEIRIGLGMQDGDILFWIRDFGPSIPDSAMNHIFTRFYQGDSSHKQEGNGLGLALVNKILRLEGGSIRAENCHGGCKFTACLQSE